MTRRNHDILALFFLFAVICVLFHPLLGRDTLFFRDLQVHFIPVQNFLARCWQSGHIPFWNPLLSCGTPFLSDIQSGVFYPPSLFFLLLPVPFALNLLVIVHYGLAVASTYGLTRLWGYSRPAAAVSALCLGLGGYLVSMANVLNNLQAAAWLPAVFYCLEKCRSGHRLFWSLACAVVLAIQFLAGEPQLLALTVFLAFFHRLFSPGQPALDRRIVETVIAFAMIGLVASLLVTVQLVPTWEMYDFSIRAKGLTFEEVTRFSFPPAAWPRLLTPPGFDVLGATGHTDWLLSVYFGFVPLALAVVAILFSRQKWVRFWTACLLVSLALSFGSHTPLFFFLCKGLPAVQMFRFPEKFFFVVAYAIAFLAGIGLDDLCRKEGNRTKEILTLFVVTALIFAGATLGSGTSPVSGAVPRPAFPHAALMVVFLGCLFLFVKALISEKPFCALVLAVCALDLFLAHQRVNPVVPSVFFREPPLSRTVRAAESQPRIFVDTKKLMAAYGVGSPLHIQSRWQASLFPAIGTLYDIAYVDGIGSMETQNQWLITELLERLTPEKQLHFLGLSGVRFVVTTPLEAKSNAAFLERLNPLEENLFEVVRALPRAYMVPDAEVAPNRAKAVERTLSDTFEPSRLVVLETPAEQEVPPGGGGKVGHISWDGPNRMEIRAHSLGGYLVVLDSFYPGWRAQINGQERKILRANGLFKALYLEPGDHHVTLFYRPSGFAWAAAVSGLALVVVLAGLWRSRPRRHSRGTKKALSDQERGPSRGMEIA